MHSHVDGGGAEGDLNGLLPEGIKGWLFGVQLDAEAHVAGVQARDQVQMSRHRCTTQAISLPPPVSGEVAGRIVVDAAHIDKSVVHMHVSLEHHLRRHAMAPVRVAAP